MVDRRDRPASGRWGLAAALAFLWSCAAPDPHGVGPEAARMLARAEAWRPGDPLPGDLLEHRDPVYEGADVYTTTDTLAIFRRVTNAELLLEIACRPGIHEKVHEFAAERALLVAGPARFYGEVDRRLGKMASFCDLDRYREILRRAEEPHAWIEGLTVDDGDFRPEEARAELDRIRSELKKRIPFEEAFGGALRRTGNLPDGRTRIGNYGEFVVSPSKPDARPFRSTRLPAGHLDALLLSKAGDVRILRDEEEKREILYFVREVYPPFYPDKARLVPAPGEGDPEGAWRRRRRHVLAGFQLVAGPLPPESRRVPLSPEVLEEVATDRYVRRKVSFAVEPGDRLAAYLFIPKGLKGKAPAALCLHPTDPLGGGVPAGIGNRTNRAYARELAERGFVTLSPDYPGFGDCRVDPYALGYASATMKGIWNHRRAVDYLQSLPEVDPGAIGAIGHSLGGHNAIFAALFDRRLRAVASSCGFTSFPKYYGGDLAGWSHRGYMPRIASVYGKDPRRMPFDFTELIGALERPVFVNAPLRDGNFEVSGVRDCIEAARPVVAFWREPPPVDPLQARYPDAGHDFPPEVRQEAYDFLRKSLAR